MVGVLEEPERKERKAFRNLDELWEILNPGRKESEGKKKGGGKKVVHVYPNIFDAITIQ